MYALAFNRVDFQGLYDIAQSLFVIKKKQNYIGLGYLGLGAFWIGSHRRGCRPSSVVKKMGRMQSPSQIGKDRCIFGGQAVGQFAVFERFLPPLGSLEIEFRKTGQSWNVVWFYLQSV